MRSQSSSSGSAQTLDAPVAEPSLHRPDTISNLAILSGARATRSIVGSIKVVARDLWEAYGWTPDAPRAYFRWPMTSFMLRRLMLFCLLLTGVFAVAATMKAQQAPASAAAAAPTAPPQAGPRGGGRGAPPVRSPEVSDGRVTFRLRAPNAKEVAVALAGNRLTMQKDEQGVWSATTDAVSYTHLTLPTNSRV